MAEITIKDIERVIEKGFDKQAVLINNAFQAHSDHFDKQISGLRDDIGKLDAQIAGLNNKINNYLELADKRYLELKKKYLQVVKCLEQIGNKTGVKVDLAELEQFQ